MSHKTQTINLIPQMTFKNHTGKVTFVSICQNSRYGASCGLDEYVYIYDLKMQITIARLTVDFVRTETSPFFNQVVFLQECEILMYVNGPVINIWNIKQIAQIYGVDSKDKRENEEIEKKYKVDLFTDGGKMFICSNGNTISIPFRSPQSHNENIEMIETEDASSVPLSASIMGRGLATTSSSPEAIQRQQIVEYYQNRSKPADNNRAFAYTFSFKPK